MQTMNNTKKKVLVLGGQGQLALALKRTQTSQYEVSYLDKAQLNIAIQSQLEQQILSMMPDCIINTAAYTAVDKAEGNPDAYLINHLGAENVAKISREINAQLVHISTDFVFSGQSASPYQVGDPVAPISDYGMSKWYGERSVLLHCPQAIIFRTSWLYSSFSNNFVTTMLRLMKERESLSIVEDQIGCPTWANTFASLLWDALLYPSARGIYHWSDSGATTWFSFADEIQKCAFTLGLLPKKIPLLPITTEEYAAQAKRPAYSVLDCSTSEATFNVSRRPWQDNLQMCLKELVK